MNNAEIVSIINEIKQNPEGCDFATCLYSAVGLIKRDKSAGTVYLALQLVDTIQEASGGNLSNFCKRRIEIIKEESTKPMGDFLEKMAKMMEYNDSIPKELR